MSDYLRTGTSRLIATTNSTLKSVLDKDGMLTIIRRIMNSECTKEIEMAGGVNNGVLVEKLANRLHNEIGHKSFKLFVKQHQSFLKSLQSYGDVFKFSSNLKWITVCSPANTHTSSVKVKIKKKRPVLLSKASTTGTDSDFLLDENSRSHMDLDPTISGKSLNILVDEIDRKAELNVGKSAVMSDNLLADTDVGKAVDIASWLRKSDLFESNLAAGLELTSESFSDSNKCYIRDNADITSLSDFFEVIRCIDYWGVKNWPDSVYEFAFSHPDEVSKHRCDLGYAMADHVDFSTATFSLIHPRGRKVDTMPRDINILMKLGECGSVGWLRFMFAKWGRCQQWDDSACHLAAGNGHLACLEYAYENGCPWNALTCSNAAGSGHLPCLKYAHENCCPWNSDTCWAAAMGGHVACLSYAHENGAPWDESTCCAAAFGGHLSCLRYAHESGCPWDVTTCWYAAENGHLSCLAYAHTNGLPLDLRVSSNASYFGHLSCLQYAHENGCPWDEETFSAAELGGQIHCQAYALDNGCPRN